jgi:hypothetical protein
MRKFWPMKTSWKPLHSSWSSEEEKNAADARLEEEFRTRAELEEKYYRNMSQILEEVAPADVQASAYDTSV